ncbi:MAG TPA: acyl carrier protein [Vicinamibacterales bacterium]|jgi:acyl carrier protein|nr:acyl carrier protein [Vicinamibacterales bacterium]
MTTTVERVKAMAAAHFGVDPARVDVDQPIATLGADSLGYLEFLFALEDAFSITIDQDAAEKVPTLRALADLVDSVATKGPQTS